MNKRKDTEPSVDEEESLEEEQWYYFYLPVIAGNHDYVELPQKSQIEKRSCLVTRTQVSDVVVERYATRPQRL